VRSSSGSVTTLPAPQMSRIRGTSASMPITAPHPGIALCVIVPFSRIGD
jgi:hypothetical protein